MTTKQTRAPRKTKVAQVIESVESEGSTPLHKYSYFEQMKAEEGYPEISTKRFVLGLAVSMLTSFTFGALVLGPVLEAFIVGAMVLTWPMFIILMGYLLIAIAGIYFGSKLCMLPAKAIWSGRLDTACSKVSNLFNFRNEVTA